MTNKAKINLKIARLEHILSDFQRGLLYLSFSEEVKEAMWSILDDKSPSLNGFNSKFYKASWDVVGDDIANSIIRFSLMGKCPRAGRLPLLL